MYFDIKQICDISAFILQFYVFSYITEYLYDWIFAQLDSWFTHMLWIRPEQGIFALLSTPVFALYVRLTREVRLANKKNQANFTQRARRNQNKLDFSRKTNIWNPFKMKLPSLVTASWQFTFPSALLSRRWLTAIGATRAPHSIWLFFFLTERSSSFCHQPPEAPPPLGTSHPGNSLMCHFTPHPQSCEISIFW